MFCALCMALFIPVRWGYTRLRVPSDGTAIALREYCAIALLSCRAGTCDCGSMAGVVVPTGRAAKFPALRQLPQRGRVFQGINTPPPLCGYHGLDWARRGHSMAKRLPLDPRGAKLSQRPNRTTADCLVLLYTYPEAFYDGR